MAWNKVEGTVIVLLTARFCKIRPMFPAIFASEFTFKFKISVDLKHPLR